MDLAFLSDIGLTKNEIKIYDAMLKLGSVSTGKITFETGLHRSRVYEGLSRLVEKGLVSFIKKGKTTYFEATATEKILDVLEEEQNKLQAKIKNIKAAIPKINKLREKKPTAEAHILYGIEGFKAMRRDVLKHAKENLLMLGAVALEDKVMPTFFEQWDSERKRHGITLKILYKESAKNSKVAHSNLDAEIRFLPKYVNNPAVINIYGDRVVDILWKGTEPLCFMMINKDLADAYRKYFDFLWKASKK